MPLLDTFELKVITGKRAGPEKPCFAVNGFSLDFDSVSGGTQPGQTMIAVGSPKSFPHILVLRGPESGAWDIDEAEITYSFDDEIPYSVRLGAIRLEANTDLNLWYARPPVVVDV